MMDAVLTIPEIKRQSPLEIFDGSEDFTLSRNKRVARLVQKSLLVKVQTKITGYFNTGGVKLPARRVLAGG